MLPFHIAPTHIQPTKRKVGRTTLTEPAYASWHQSHGQAAPGARSPSSLARSGGCPAVVPTAAHRHGLGARPYASDFDGRRTFLARNSEQVSSRQGAAESDFVPLWRTDAGAIASLACSGCRRGVGGDGYVVAKSFRKKAFRLPRLLKCTGVYFLRHCDVRKIVPCQPRAQPEYCKLKVRFTRPKLL